MKGKTMGFNLRSRNVLGPRFGELMGKHCHAAITAANKGDRDAYEARVADIYQMLDTVETESWPEEKEVKSEPTPVAPKAKRVAKDKGNKKPARERAAKATKTSDGYGDQHGGA